MKKRYGVQRCDEGGTLFDNEGNQVDHTWDVVDRWTVDRDGHPKVVLNVDRRSTARDEARELNRINEEQP